MVEVSVVRWKKYGKDRLYVHGPDGQRIGFADLVSGVVTAELGENRPAVELAVQRWRDGEEQGSPTPEPAMADAARTPFPSMYGEPPVENSSWAMTELGAQLGTHPAAAVVAPCAQVVTPAWEDLAGRRAGQMIRELAVAARKAAPVRTFLARLLGIHTQERAWRIGADGEEMVGVQLAALLRKDPRWRVLHGVPVGEKGSDIDHVVIGPGGVFTLNTKHHPGAKIWVGGNTFMVRGQRCPYVRNSRHEAARAQRLLTDAAGVTLCVAGVIVPVGAQGVTIKTAPDDVHVVTRRNLVKWLRSRPTVLDTNSVERIYDVARRSTTWQPPA